MQDGSTSLETTQMSELRALLVESEQVARDGLRHIARLRRKLKQRLGLLSPPRLDLYIGMGTAHNAQIRGRALEDPPLRPPSKEDSSWDNFRRSFRLFETDEIADLEVEVCVGDTCARCTTDAAGFFQAEVHLEKPLPSGWNEVTAQPLGHEFARPIVGRLLVPKAGAKFGVISDIDDTILQTHVRNTAKMVWVTVIGNALTRLSFDGAPELYQGLRRGGKDAPFFYVSRSAWNIHFLLEHFIRHRGFPEGPLSLRDAGLITPPSEFRFSKAREAEKILRRYEPLPFVLIGDSGERDAEIYTGLSRKYPGRVLAILIRQVTEARHAARARQWLEEHAGCPSLLFERDTQAQAWCQERGLWHADAEA